MRRREWRIYRSISRTSVLPCIASINILATCISVPRSVSWSALKQTLTAASGRLLLVRGRFQLAVWVVRLLQDIIAHVDIGTSAQGGIVVVVT
eukprot:8848872-Pyramimonas_sp.AAC.1